MTINRAGNDVVRHLALLRRLLVALVLLVLVQGPASSKNLHRRSNSRGQLLLSAASASVRWWPLAVPCVLLAVVLPRYGGHCYAKNEKESFGEFVNALLVFETVISVGFLCGNKCRKKH